MSPSSTFTARIPDIQAFLRRENLAGWLIYDFHGINAVARTLVPPAEFHVTRRWFYFIPAQGEPVLLAHRIEEKNFPPLPGKMQFYAGRADLLERLRALLPAGQPLAMEYSPMNDVPTVSYVDAGMLELLRSFGVQVVTSAQLIQEFQARWSTGQLQTHIAAAKILHEAQSQAFARIAAALRANQPITEYDVQQFIVEKIAAADCISDAEAIIAVNANASNPHYAPTASVHSPIRKGDVILIDLWAKKNTPGAVYADITWMGFAGRQIPARVQEVFNVVKTGRDCAVELLQKRSSAGEPVHGYEVDQVVRGFITDAGYGEYFVHRTGHSLGTLTHDNGVNIDGYETRDTRTITPGVAFSIEPGIYLPEDFGIRSEINVYMGMTGPEIHTTPQQEITRIELD
ncbi:MAG: M24 family metallopeptidase [bacterium]